MPDLRRVSGCRLRLRHGLGSRNLGGRGQARAGAGRFCPFHYQQVAGFGVFGREQAEALAALGAGRLAFLLEVAQAGGGFRAEQERVRRVRKGIGVDAGSRNGVVRHSDEHAGNELKQRGGNECGHDNVLFGCGSQFLWLLR